MLRKRGHPSFLHELLAKEGKSGENNASTKREKAVEVDLLQSEAREQEAI